MYSETYRAWKLESLEWKPGSLVEEAGLDFQDTVHNYVGNLAVTAPSSKPHVRV
jgi:hypothetical protein